MRFSTIFRFLKRRLLWYYQTIQRDIMAAKKHIKSKKAHRGFRKADSFALDNKDVHKGFFVTDGTYMFKRRGRRLQLFDHTQSARELDRDAHIHYAIRRKDLKQAWKIVSTQMMANGIGSASVAWARHETKKKWSELQKIRATLEDRQSITLYNNGKDAALWQDMMRTIEDEFIKHGIRPGRAPGNKQRIKGSQYAYIENDTGNLARGININPVYDDFGLPRYGIPEENITNEMLEEAFAENAETMEAGEEIADPFADVEYSDEDLILDGPLCDEDVELVMSLPMDYEIDPETGEASLILDISDEENFPAEETYRARAAMAAMGISSTIESRAGGLPGKLRIDPASMALFEDVQMDYMRLMAQQGVFALGHDINNPRLFDKNHQQVADVVHVNFDPLTAPLGKKEFRMDPSKGKAAWAVSQALYRTNMRLHLEDGVAPPELTIANKPWEDARQSAYFANSKRAGIVRSPVLVDELSAILTGRRAAYRESIAKPQPQQPVTDTHIIVMPKMKVA